MKVHRLLVLLAILGLLLFAGCGGGGGGGGGGGTGTPPPGGGGDDLDYSQYIVEGGVFTTDEIITPTEFNREIVEWPREENVEALDGQLCIFLFEEATADDLRALRQLIEDQQGEVIGQDVSTLEFLVEFPSMQDALDFADRINDLRYVLHVAPNRIISVPEPSTGSLDVSTSNFANQIVDLGGLVTENPDLSQYEWAYWIDQIRARHAWTALSANNITYGSRHVPVAIIDMGMDPNLVATLFADKDCWIDPNMVDAGSHGVAVASLALAPGADGIAGVGVAWDATMYFYDVSLRGRPGIMSTSLIRSYTSKAINRGVRVINWSLGHDISTEQDEWDFRWQNGSLIEKAHRNGCLVVFSAGNEYKEIQNQWLDPDRRTWLHRRTWDRRHEAYSSSMIIVGGTHINRGYYRPDSNEGTNRGSIVELFAPGQRVLTQQGAREDSFPSDYLGVESGTSLAAPLVSGAAAVIWSLDPDQTGATIKQRLIETANRRNEHGIPILDLHAAVRLYLPNERPSVRIVSGPSGTTTVLSPTFTWEGDDSDGRIEFYQTWMNDRNSGTVTNHDRNTISASHGPLPPGQHTFYLRAQDNDGEWSETVSRSFEVVRDVGNLPIIVD